MKGTPELKAARETDKIGHFYCRKFEVIVKKCLWYGCKFYIECKGE